MQHDPKITLIGAGGMSFGPIMVLDAINSPKLRGALMMLHDINAEKLDVVYNLARRLNEKHGNPIRIERTLDPEAAMTAADFCLMSTEVGRFPYWKQDYEIPLKYGATHITGENGGPGAVFHSLRSIKTCLEICENITRYCPNTFLINLTNPMSRVTLAINAATTIRNVGLCHEFGGGLMRLGLLLRLPPRKIKAKASGINHFTFFYDLRHAETGEDLYPRVRQLWTRRYFQYPPVVTTIAKALINVPLLGLAVEQMHAPLVAYMFREYGWLPTSVDSHIGEYVPFAQAVAGWHPVPVEFHRRLCGWVDRLSTAYGEGRLPLPLHRLGRSGEQAFPIIEALHTGERAYLGAVNVPNRGYVPNLPEGAIVEIPAWTGTTALEPETVPPIPQPLADFMKTQVEIQDLVVKAALARDPAPAFEALRMDPLSPPDERRCRNMFDELMAAQAGALPF
jgi:alpha-galactosidase